MVGVSVREALACKALLGTRVLAGEAGLDRTITRVTVVEVPDYHSFVHEGELAFTTGYGLKDDIQSQREIVPYLASKGLAGLAIKPRWFSELPREALEAADALAFPILELPADAYWSALLVDVSQLILAREISSMTDLQSKYSRLIAAFGDGGAARLLQELSAAVDGTACLLDGSGRLLIGPCHGTRIYPPGEIIPAGGDQPGESLASGTRIERLHHDLVRIVAPVANRVQPLGQLVVVRAGAPDESDLLLVEKAASMVAVTLGSEAISQSVYRDQDRLLQGWLTGMVRDTEELQEQARLLGCALAPRYTPIWLQVSPPKRPSGRESSPAAITAFVRVWLVPQAGDMVTAMRQGLVILLGVGAEEPAEHSRTRALEVAEQLTQALQTRLPGVRARAVLGARAESLGEVPAAYRNLLAGVQMVEAFALGLTVADTSELDLYRMLYQVRGTQELQDFVRQTIGALIAHDETHGTDLVRTLQAFLAAGKNLKETASAIHAHYNTVRYRLDSITRLTGRSLANAEDCLKFHLALKLLRLARA